MRRELHAPHYVKRSASPYWLVRNHDTAPLAAQTQTSSSNQTEDRPFMENSCNEETTSAHLPQFQGKATKGSHNELLLEPWPRILWILKTCI